MGRSDATEYRLLIELNGRIVNDYGVKNWPGVLRDVRAFRTLQRRGKVVGECVGRVQCRAHGPALWQTIEPPSWGRSET